MKHQPHTPFALLATLALTASPLLAQQQVLDQSQDEKGPLTSYLEGEHALGDMGKMRTNLEDHGVDFFGGYTAEVWGNTTGGLKRGTVYTGLLDFGVNLDFEKLVGWKGASFSTTWLWLSGRDASEDLVGNFLTVSNIAGFNTLRMLEMWYQQDFWQREGDGALPGLSIRVGQLTADSEFIISDYGSTFINGTFGWPAFAYTNIPDGGPGYPMGAPGVRVAVTPVQWFTFQAAAFQGDVFAQDVNTVGFDWRLQRNLGYTLLGEAQFRWNHQEEETGLPGQLKVGAWFDTADFPAAYGDNAYWGNSGYYAIVDQMLFREPSKPVEVTSKDGKSVAAPDGKSDAKSFKEPVKYEKSTQGLGAFARISFDPQDRNFVGFYFDTGLVYTGLIPGRDDDAIGLALGYANLTQGAAQTLFDDGSRKNGYEMVIEGTYDAQITKWLHIQPDLQYIVRPGGSGDLGNAFVLGGRVSVTF
ncbi:MAG TPA: carbohydrate porin [Chthoniobacterales bacterium]|nr:carbohydrate porin [Chthoniobacterales bacterium]